MDVIIPLAPAHNLVLFRNLPFSHTLQKFLFFCFCLKPFIPFKPEGGLVLFVFIFPKQNPPFLWPPQTMKHQNH